MAKLKLLEARVLVAIGHLGVDCSHVVSGTEAHIKSLAKAGLVDADEGAVAYAKSIGAKVVEIGAEVLEELVGAVSGGETESPPPAPSPAPAPDALPPVDGK